MLGSLKLATQRAHGRPVCDSTVANGSSSSGGHRQKRGPHSAIGAGHAARAELVAMAGVEGDAGLEAD